MKLHQLLLLLMFLPMGVVGQQYSTAYVRAKADSILRTYIGDSVFYKHCVYDTNTYYEFKNIFGNSNYETLSKFKKTKGKFVEVDMRWYLAIPYPQCPAYDTIGGMTSFVLDNALNPRGKPHLKFIPDFYWTKDSCHLISKEEALAIAKQRNLRPAIDTLKAGISYDTKSKTFSWKISQTLWLKKNALNDDYGEMEIVSVDAISGKVISHEVFYVGPVY